MSEKIWILGGGGRTGSWKFIVIYYPLEDFIGDITDTIIYNFYCDILLGDITDTIIYNYSCDILLGEIID